MKREDFKRLSKQCAAIIARLRSGPATNRELAGIALKYTSRISDCRDAGYDIPEPEQLGGGLTRYRLIEKAQLSLLGAA